MPLFWELLGTDMTAEKAEEQRNILRSLIKRKNWRPPSSDGPIHVNAELEGTEEIAVIMQTSPKGTQAVLGSGK